MNYFTTPFTGCATYTTYALTYSVPVAAAKVATYTPATNILVLDYTGSDLSGDFGIATGTPSVTYVLTLTGTYTGAATTLTATTTFNLILQHSCSDTSYSYINVP